MVVASGSIQHLACSSQAAAKPDGEGTRLKMLCNLCELRKHLLSRYKNLLKGGSEVGSWSLGNVWGVLVELGRDTQGWQGPQDPDVASGMSRRIATSNQHP